MKLEHTGAGVRSDDEQAVFGSVTLGSGLLNEVFFRAREPRQIVHDRGWHGRFSTRLRRHVQRKPHWALELVTEKKKQQGFR